MVSPLALGPGGIDVAAQQALLLAGPEGETEGAAPLVLAQDVRGDQGGGRAAGVVVRAGGCAAAGHVVQVRADDVDVAGVCGPGALADDVAVGVARHGPVVVLDVQSQPCHVLADELGGFFDGDSAVGVPRGDGVRRAADRDGRFTAELGVVALHRRDGDLIDHSLDQRVGGDRFGSGEPGSLCPLQGDGFQGKLRELDPLPGQALGAGRRGPDEPLGVAVEHHAERRPVGLRPAGRNHGEIVSGARNISIENTVLQAGGGQSTQPVPVGPGQHVRARGVLLLGEGRQTCRLEAIQGVIGRQRHVDQGRSLRCRRRGDRHPNARQGDRAGKNQEKSEEPAFHGFQFHTFGQILVRSSTAG